MDDSFIPHCLLGYAPADVSPKVLSLLLRKLDNARGVRLPASPAADDVSALVTQHGYRLAEEIAKTTEDPLVLAKLAKNSSVQVRRVVAESHHMDQDTVEYLWHWAWTKDDRDAMRSLAPSVSFAALLAQTVTRRYMSESWYSRYGPCPTFSLEARLRDGPDRTVENMRAAISCRNIDEALAAVKMCAAGRFDGLSYIDALALFVEQQSRIDHDLDSDGFTAGASATCSDQYTVICLLHTLAQKSPVMIDEELAGLVVRFADRLTGLDPFSRFVNSSPDETQQLHTRHYGVGTSPLPVTATPAAARILMEPVGHISADASAALINAFLNLANRSELRRELDAGSVFAAYWALQDRSPLLNSSLANQELRLLRHDHVDPPSMTMDLPTDIAIDGDLLAWVVHNSAADGLDGFVSGRYLQVPCPSMVNELLNGCWFNDGEPDPAEVTRRARRIMHCFDRWKDQPWADALVEALGPAMFTQYAPYQYVADRLFAEFGESVELWAGCLGLLEPGFPGSLPDLFDMVWAMFGDGLTRPDLTTFSPSVPETSQLPLFDAASEQA